MISRRQLRVKVLQLLYESEINTDIDTNYLKKRLRKLVNETHEIFIYHLYTMYKICDYVYAYEKIQHNKLLVDDKVIVSRKLVEENTYYTILHNSTYFKKKIEQYNLASKIDETLIKSAFNQLIKSKLYRKYVTNTEPSVAKDNLVFQEIYLEILLEGDFFDSVCELNFQTWNDDYNLISGYVIGFLKNAPNIPNYLESLDNSVDEEDILFGEALMLHCLNKQNEFKQAINAVLNNWDLDRIGNIERLLLYMTIAEIQYFEIPDKVTINEYIEIAKIYASEKSHEFINGVIDKLITSKLIIVQ